MQLRDSIAALCGLATTCWLSGCIFLDSDAPEASPYSLDFQHDFESDYEKTQTSERDEPLRPNSLRVDDIEKQYQLVGKLGKPLGEFSTVRGIWKPLLGEGQFKHNPLAFFVTHIDGVDLDEDIVFERQLLKDISSYQHDDWPAPSDGAIWDVRVFEDAAMFGMPYAASNEAGFMGQQGQNALPWGLQSRMNYMSRPRVFVPDKAQPQ